MVAHGSPVNFSPFNPRSFTSFWMIDGALSARYWAKDGVQTNQEALVDSANLRMSWLPALTSISIGNAPMCRIPHNPMVVA